MATLIHEIWVSEAGQPVACIFAGALGQDARKFIEPGATLASTFSASSHFEAMTVYYEHNGWRAYKAVHPVDHQPYAGEWAALQSSNPSA